MTDNLPLPGDDKKKPTISFARIAIWVIVGGIGLYLLISGIVGILVKAG
jgi:hypothetical protein